MSSIDSINPNLNSDIHQLLAKITTIEPKPSDNPENSSSTFEIMQLQILNYLKGLQSGMDILLNEVTAVKRELNDYKKLTHDNELKIKKLEAENKVWQDKIELSEVRNRANTLILSGPAIKIRQTYSPAQMRNESIKNIKEIYNFNLRKEDVFNCQQMRTGNNKTNGQILLTINNAIVKNELITAVIKKDKSKGVNLNICEYLTKHNANALYQLRNLRKDHRGKLFSCFSRNGFIYYKLTKDANPTKVSGQADIDNLKRDLEEKQNCNPVAGAEPQQTDIQSQGHDNGASSTVTGPQPSNVRSQESDSGTSLSAPPPQLMTQQDQPLVKDKYDRGNEEPRRSQRKFRKMDSVETETNMQFRM